MGKYLLAIDQGTSSTRSVLYDDKGRFIDSSQLEFKQYFPQEGWVEHNPEEIWESVLSTLGSLVKRNSLFSKDIASIGITNQRETTIVWDRKDGKPIYNAIVWQDRRTADFCSELNDQIEMVNSRTGLTIDPYFSATKVNWILNHVKGARKRALAGELLFGTIDSYLIWKLSGGMSHKTDVTNASRTMLFNIEEQKWDEDLLNLFEIPRSMLPEVCDNVFDFGTTSVLGGEVSIGGVAGDQQAALIGQCCVKPGEVKSTYGTGCFLILNTGTERLHSQSKLLTTVAYRVNGKITYALEGSIFVAGSAIQWLRDEMEFFSDASDTEKLAMQASDESNVLVIPALTGLGAPYWDASARGAIFGLTRDSTKADIVRATLESVVFLTKDLLEAMSKDNASFNSLKIDGGMVANSWFCQKLSNILGVEVERPKIIETTSLGAAFLAGISAGLFDDLNGLKESREIERTFFPEKESNKYLEWKKAVKKVLT
ncbi:MAG: glycerol kinase GlpK [Pseudomonadota bacterium]|nr:glycerol kinase GlpK [Pseudomonadota bacterium]